MFEISIANGARNQALVRLDIKFRYKLSLFLIFFFITSGKLKAIYKDYIKCLDKMKAIYKFLQIDYFLVVFSFILYIGWL